MSGSPSNPSQRTLSPRRENQGGGLETQIFDAPLPPFQPGDILQAGMRLLNSGGSVPPLARGNPGSAQTHAQEAQQQSASLRQALQAFAGGQRAASQDFNTPVLSERIPHPRVFQAALQNPTQAKRPQPPSAAQMHPFLQAQLLHSGGVGMPPQPYPRPRTQPPAATRVAQIGDPMVVPSHPSPSSQGPRNFHINLPQPQGYPQGAQTRQVRPGQSGGGQPYGHPYMDQHPQGYLYQGPTSQAKMHTQNRPPFPSFLPNPSKAQQPKALPSPPSHDPYSRGLEAVVHEGGTEQGERGGGDTTQGPAEHHTGGGRPSEVTGSLPQGLHESPLLHPQASRSGLGLIPSRGTPAIDDFMFAHVFSRACHSEVVEPDDGSLPVELHVDDIPVGNRIRSLMQQEFKMSVDSFRKNLAYMDKLEKQHLKDMQRQRLKEVKDEKEEKEKEEDPVVKVISAKRKIGANDIPPSKKRASKGQAKAESPSKSEKMRMLQTATRKLAKAAQSQATVKEKEEEIEKEKEKEKGRSRAKPTSAKAKKQEKTDVKKVEKTIAKPKSRNREGENKARKLRVGPPVQEGWLGDLGGARERWDAGTEKDIMMIFSFFRQLGGYFTPSTLPRLTLEEFLHGLQHSVGTPLLSAVLRGFLFALVWPLCVKECKKVIDFSKREVKKLKTSSEKSRKSVEQQIRLLRQLESQASSLLSMLSTHSTESSEVPFLLANPDYFWEACLVTARCVVFLGQKAQFFRDFYSATSSEIPDLTRQLKEQGALHFDSLPEEVKAAKVAEDLNQMARDESEWLLLASVQEFKEAVTSDKISILGSIVLYWLSSREGVHLMDLLERGREKLEAEEITKASPLIPGFLSTSSFVLGYDRHFREYWSLPGLPSTLWCRGFHPSCQEKAEKIGFFLSEEVLKKLEASLDARAPKEGDLLLNMEVFKSKMASSPPGTLEEALLLRFGIFEELEVLKSVFDFLKRLGMKQDEEEEEKVGMDLNEGVGLPLANQEQPELSPKDGGGGEEHDPVSPRSPQVASMLQSPRFTHLQELEKLEKEQAEEKEKAEFLHLQKMIANEEGFQEEGGHADEDWRPTVAEKTIEHIHPLPLPRRVSEMSGVSWGDAYHDGEGSPLKTMRRLSEGGEQDEVGDAPPPHSEGTKLTMTTRFRGKPPSAPTGKASKYEKVIGDPEDSKGESSTGGRRRRKQVKQVGDGPPVKPEAPPSLPIKTEFSEADKAEFEAGRNSLLNLKEKLVPLYVPDLLNDPYDRCQVELRRLYDAVGRAMTQGFIPEVPSRLPKETLGALGHKFRELGKCTPRELFHYVGLVSSLHKPEEKDQPFYLEKVTFTNDAGAIRRALIKLEHNLHERLKYLHTARIPEDRQEGKGDGEANLLDLNLNFFSLEVLWEDANDRKNWRVAVAKPQKLKFRRSRKKNTESNRKSLPGDPDAHIQGYLSFPDSELSESSDTALEVVRRGLLQREAGKEDGDAEATHHSKNVSFNPYRHPLLTYSVGTLGVYVAWIRTQVENLPQKVRTLGRK